MRIAPAVMALTLLAALGCSSSMGPGGGTSGGRSRTPVMSGSAFNPTPDTVGAGLSVTWTNNDGLTHTITASPGSADAFDSGNIGGGGTFSHTFATPGTYSYYCRIHGTPTSGMHGTIVVQ